MGSLELKVSLVWPWIVSCFLQTICLRNWKTDIFCPVFRPQFEIWIIWQWDMFGHLNTRFVQYSDGYCSWQIQYILILVLIIYNMFSFDTIKLSLKPEKILLQTLEKSKIKKLTNTVTIWLLNKWIPWKSHYQTFSCLVFLFIYLFTMRESKRTLKYQICERNERSMQLWMDISFT